MKRLLAALVLCLLLCSPALACDRDACRDDIGQLAWMPPYVAAAGVSGAPAETCHEYFASSAAGDQDSAHINASNVYWGQGGYDPSENITICSVSVYLYSKTGTISSIDYQVEIYEMSGTALGNAPTGTCVSSTKNGLGTAGWYEFTGLSCQLTTTPTYGVAIKRTDGSYDADNHADFGVFTPTGYTGNWMSWGADKANNLTMSTYDVAIKINHLAVP